jgi:hypothetical protein
MGVLERGVSDRHGEISDEGQLESHGDRRTVHRCHERLRERHHVATDVAGLEHPVMGDQRLLGQDAKLGLGIRADIERLLAPG